MTESFKQDVAFALRATERFSGHKYQVMDDLGKKTKEFGSIY